MFFSIFTINFRTFLQNELLFLSAKCLKRLVIWNQFSPIWGFNIFWDTQMPYTRASVHVKSAYFWFILSSRVWNHHKGRVVFMGAIFCSSWIPFYSPSVTYGSKGIPNVEPLLWICLLLDVYLVLPRHLFSSLMFLER